MKALDLAITVSFLGPALLLRGDPVLWGVVLLLLPLHALALAQVKPPAESTRLLPWPLLVLLILLPLELMGAQYLLVRLGQPQPLPLVELCLTLWIHAGAFHVLLGRQAGNARDRRRLGVQAACFLPLSLAVLALAGGLEGWLSRLGAPDAQRLLGQGWGRLMLATLFLVLWRRWHGRHGGEASHAGL
jgi:hypothetical protein